MKNQAALLLLILCTNCSLAHEHESETAKSLDAWASLPVITHWGDTAVYVHAFLMSLATLVLLPAGVRKALDDADRLFFLSRVPCAVCILPGLI